MPLLKKLLQKIFRKKSLMIEGNHKENLIKIPKDIKFVGKTRFKFWQQSSNNQLIIGNGFKSQDVKITFKGHNSKVIIGDNVKFSGYILVVGQNRTVEIGNNTTIQGAYIMAREADIKIGADCMLSREIEIRSSDVHKIYKKGSKKRLNLPQNIIIGDKVWVGAKAFISKGSIIPNGSIIGACSFVNKEFTQENVILAGTPAAVVKEDIEWVR